MLAPKGEAIMAAASTMVTPAKGNVASVLDASRWATLGKFLSARAAIEMTSGAPATCPGVAVKSPKRPS